MQIAIPAEISDDPKADIYSHFGSAPCFVLYNSETNSYKYIDNSNQEHNHGQCQPTALLRDEEVQAVICGGMGARAVNLLNQMGIKVYVIDKPYTIEEGIQELLKGSLPELSLEGACNHHGCH